MSTIKSKKVQFGTDANSTNNFTLYQPATPDGTLRIGVGNADSPTEVAQFHSSGITMASGKELAVEPIIEKRRISTQAIVSHATYTLVDFDTEVLANPSSIYDTGTKQFTPTKAGYYEIYFQAMLDNANSPYRSIMNIHRNDSLAARGYISTPSGTESFGVTSVSTILEFNGTTDYFDCRYLVYDANSNNLTIQSGSHSTYMYYKYLGDF